MRVSCPECGAEYQFSSSAIPEGGYDAQCTNCNAVFYVVPEPTGVHRVIPDPNRIVTVACPNCDSQYQFPAKDIPSGGYDAQCTQCETVFFVSDEVENPDQQVIGSPDPSPEFSPEYSEESEMSPSTPSDTPYEMQPTDESMLDERTDPGPDVNFDPDVPDIDPLPDSQLQEPYDEDEVSEPGQKTLKVRLRDDERAALRDDDDDVPEIDDYELEAIPEADASLLEDVSEITGEVSVPEPPLPDEVGVQEPVRRQTAPMPVMPEPLTPTSSGLYEQTTQPIDNDYDINDDDLGEQFQAGKRRGLMIVAALALTGVLGFAAYSMLVSDPSKSEPYLTHFDKGNKALRLDTDQGYKDAVTEFRQALKVAPESAEAKALLGLAKIMRGANVEERGRFLVEKGTQLKKKHNGLESDDPAAQKLIDEVETLASEANSLRETGRKDINDGFSSLQSAMQQGTNDPVVFDAVAIYYSFSDGALKKSQKIANQSLALRGLEPSDAVWSSPPSPWLSLAMSRVKVGLEKEPEKARRILEATLKADPSVQRARFALAELAVKESSYDDARSTVGLVTATHPEHERGLLWLERLNLMSGAKAPAVGSPDATAAAKGEEPVVASADTGDEVSEDDDDKKKKKKRQKKRPRKKRKRKKR
ncbi:MAG: zinc-ribbon domain-containing protein [Myxococcota bacterium]